MQRPPARLLASAAVLAALAVGGCSTTTGSGSPDTTGSIAPTPRRAPLCNGGRRWMPGAQRYRANPADPDAAIRYAQALRASASARRPPPSSSNPRSTIRTTAPCSAPMAARSPTTATSSRRSTCSTAPIRRTSPTGASCRCRARCSTRWAAMPTRSGYYASALRLMPDEPSVLSNLGLSYALSKNLPEAETTLRRAAAQRGRRAEGAAESRAGGRPAGPLPGGRDHRARRSLARARPPPTSPICGRCWRSRATGKRASAARRWRRRPAPRADKLGRYLALASQARSRCVRGVERVLRRHHADGGGPENDHEQHRQEEQDHRHGELGRQRRRPSSRPPTCACRGFPATSRAASGPSGVP